MLTRTLATLTLLLALTGGTDLTPPADTRLDPVRAAHRSRVAAGDEVDGCREAPAAPAPVAPAACSDAGEGQP